MKLFILAILASTSFLASAGTCPFTQNPTPPGHIYTCMCDQSGNCYLVLIKK